MTLLSCTCQGWVVALTRCYLRVPLYLQENTKGNDNKFLTCVIKGKLSSSLLGTVFSLLSYMMLSTENKILGKFIGKTSILKSQNCEGVTCCGSRAAQKWCTPTAITGESCEYWPEWLSIPSLPLCFILTCAARLFVSLFFLILKKGTPGRSTSTA